MSLKDKLIEDMKDAMRAKDSLRLGVIRFLRSEIKNVEIDNGEQDDKGIIKIIAKQVKSMKDANSEYLKGGREDLVEENNAKINVLEAYLPKQLTDEELETIVKKIIDGASDTHMGKIIGQVVKEVEGKADGGRVSTMVKKLLS